MFVEQFVMAYEIEQDRIRALLPDGYCSLRPVLRINTEIRTENDSTETYIELNTPVSHYGVNGWLNIDHWKTPEYEIRLTCSDGKVILSTNFLELEYKGTGIPGGCPAEKDNAGTFFIGQVPAYRKNEIICENKEFCDCAFRWKFTEDSANGISERASFPAFPEPVAKIYPKSALNASNASLIPCRRVLGSYIVRFTR